jgi:hypothetical protein
MKEGRMKDEHFEPWMEAKCRKEPGSYGQAKRQLEEGVIIEGFATPFI